MKKYLLLLLATFALFGNQEKTENSEKKPDDKKSYCYKPAGEGEYKKINSKGDNRVDIKFEYCMFNGEKVENAKVGIISNNLEKAKKYIKTYSYLHFRDGDRLKETSENIYYYNGRWGWSSSSAYPALLLNEKTKGQK